MTDGFGFPTIQTIGQTLLKITFSVKTPFLHQQNQTFKNLKKLTID
jgi:hypothetical protein